MNQLHTLFSSNILESPNDGGYYYTIYKRMEQYDLPYIWCLRGMTHISIISYEHSYSIKNRLITSII